MEWVHQQERAPRRFVVRVDGELDRDPGRTLQPEGRGREEHARERCESEATNPGLHGNLQWSVAVEMPPGPAGFGSLRCERDRSLEAPDGDLGAPSFRTGRESQLAPGGGCRELRLRRAQGVGDGSADREHVEVGDRARRYPQVDRAALAFELDHAAAPQVTVEADVARDGLEPAALHSGAAALPPGGTDGDTPAQR